MGNKKSNLLSIEEQELKEMSLQYDFNFETIKKLDQFFKYISQLDEDDGMITIKEFIQQMGNDESYFNQCLFNYFDRNSDQKINFREFILGIQNLKSNDLYLTTFSTFQLYKNENDEFISKEKLKKLIKNGLQMQKIIDIDKIDVDSIVDAQFQQDKIDFNQYQTYLKQNQQLVVIINQGIKNLELFF